MQAVEQTGIAKAIAVVGNQDTLASQLGVTQQAVSGWLAQGFVPSGRAAEIEHLTGVPRGELVSAKIKNLMAAAGGEL